MYAIKIKDLDVNLISLDEAKTYLHVDGDHENEMIRGFLDGAIQGIEERIGQKLTRALYQETFLEEKAVPKGDDLCWAPSVSPLIRLHSLKNGKANVEGRVQEDHIFIEKRFLGAGGLVALYEAGYGSEALPPDLKLAILRLVAHFYEERTGKQMGAALHHLKEWLAPYRRYRVR